MNTTDKKEQIIIDINTFLKSNNYSNAIKLLEYYVEDKDSKTKDEALKLFSTNPQLFSLYIKTIIDKLTEKYHIFKLSNKNNQLILVF